MKGTTMDEHLFLLQMAGPPGCGKSRLAAAIAAARQAVILNSDLVKSTLLDTGVEWKTSGPAAYQTLVTLADDLLSQGHNVILDSPSHYSHIPQNGQRVAHARGARYKFIELTCPDLDELHRRLTERTPMRSQMRTLDQMPPDSDGTTAAIRVGTHQWQSLGPDGGWAVLDATIPFEAYLAQALEYLEQ
jgi:predicted kinase